MALPRRNVPCPGPRTASGRLRRTTRWFALVTAGALAAAACGGPALERLSRARRLAADLLVEFTKAVDAGNRAVMAHTDEASAAFAREAEQARLAVERDFRALKPVLQGLGYAEEARLLDEFGSRFGEYRALDRTILGLAVENTNLKAQRLSFGPAQEAADAFRHYAEAVAPSEAKDTWRVRAYAASAVAAVREIQVLQAAHIADPDDAAMSRIEERIATSEAAARSALQALTTLVGPSHRPRLTSAGAALDRFMDVNAQITRLSRRNTNVRSLALALNQKGKLAGACEHSLRALRQALEQRGFAGTR